jgi:PAS domain S-box-containing protein
MEQHPPRNGACGGPDPDPSPNGKDLVRPDPSDRTGATHVSRLWPAVVVGAVILAAPTHAAAQAPRQILILYADRHDLPMNQILDPKLRADFRAGLGDRVEVYSEHINVTSFPGRDGHKKLLEFLHHKYSPRGLDLIVTVASVALDAVQDNRDWFFPNTPVVYLCVAEGETRTRSLRSGVTGIPVKLDFGEFARVALRLRPNARRVVLVAGASPDDTAFADAARRDLQAIADRAELVSLVGLPMDQLLGEVARLPGDAVILYVQISLDGSGRSFIPREALDQIARAAPAPVFGAYDSYLGHGIVGGHVVSFEGEAENAARLGLRILAGEDPSVVSTGSVTACAHVFDWRELRRWGIDEGRLPPGSVVRYRSPGVWDLYKWHVVGVLTVTVLEGVLIGCLLAARARRRRAEDALRESEARFRLMADSAPILIWSSGVDKGCTYLNRPWLEFTGRTLEQELGNGWAESVHPDDRARCLEVYAAHFDAREPFEMEYRLRRHDGEYRWIVDRGVPRLSPDGVLAGYVGACIDITDRKRAEGELRASYQKQQNLASQLLTAQEGERRRIAREMHDDLTQRLAALAIEVNKLERLPALAGPEATRLGAVRGNLVKMSEYVHNLSRQLHPSILDDLGLVDALRSECTLFQEREGIEVRFLAEGVPADLPREVCLGLYRIAQEGLRNVARHSGAARAEVSLLGRGPDVLLTVSDGGKGFERNGRGGSGIGLAGMEERARLIGAELTIESAPGKGTTVTALVSRSGERS